MKIATVTTTRRPGWPLLSFVEYHLLLGVSHMFIFYEGERDEALDHLMKRSQTTLIECDDRLRKEWLALESFPKVEKFLDREVQARQILNAELGVRRAKELGMDWIAHLDTDELLFQGAGALIDHFKAAERAEASQLVFLNHEAVPEREEIGDYFKEVTLFKANLETTRDRRLALPFIAYKTGKAAARLDRDPVPWGVHRFSSRRGNTRSLRSKACTILHYPSCGFSRYAAKYETLGAFEDKYFDRAPIPRFYLEARDLILTGRNDEARTLYQERVMLSGCTTENKQRLLEAGYLLRICAPSELLEMG